VEARSGGVRDHDRIRFAIVRLLYVVTSGAAVTLLTACGSGTITSHGVMQVQEDCSSATSDYPDVDQGTQVVVTNSTGAVIATSQLGDSKQNDLPGRLRR
jgi:hypothetical protein